MMTSKFWNNRKAADHVRGEYAEKLFTAKYD